MNLLDKLAKVEIQQDSRIRDADRAFCEAHQQAYDEARKDLQILLICWNDMYSKQQELLYDIMNTPYEREKYIRVEDLKTRYIEEQLKSTHGIFISSLISYFNRTYRVSVDADPICEFFLPQKPSCYAGEDAITEYQEQMQALSLSYPDILEQIFIQLGNRTFLERGIEELKEHCHLAAWNLNSGSKYYELKNATITFLYGFCYASTFLGNTDWHLQSKLRDIIHGLAFFETKVFNQYPYDLKWLLNASSLPTSSYKFDDYKTLMSIRLFKNGRVDVKFKSEAHAEEFAKDFLGLTC